MAVEPQYRFVHKPDEELECVICLSVAEDPFQHTEREQGKGCGKLLCARCLERYGRGKPCPHCKTGSHFIEDIKSKRAIRELPIECNDPVENCGWKGTFGTRHTHKAKCQLTLVPCPNECKEGRVKRKDFDKHVKKDCKRRDYECKHCKTKGIYNFITQEHDQVCELKVIACPVTGCKVMMKRKDIDKHTKEDCQYAIVSCRYYEFGCDVKLSRKDLIAHEQNNEFHLLKAADQAKHRIESVECRIKIIGVLMLLLLVGFITMAVWSHGYASDVSELKLLNNHVSDDVSELKLWSSNASGDVLELKLKSSHISDEIKFWSSLVKDLSSSVSGSSSIVNNLNDQIADLSSIVKDLNSQVSDRNSIVTSQILDMISFVENLSSQVTDWSSIVKDLNSQVSDSNSIVNSQVLDMISFVKNLSSQVTDWSSHVSELKLWSIHVSDDISVLKLWNSHVLEWSSNVSEMLTNRKIDISKQGGKFSFYIGIKYHMEIIVNVNEYDNRESTMVIDVAMKEGKYDDELKWPFTGRITVTLLNKRIMEHTIRKTLLFTDTDNIRPNWTSRVWSKRISNSLFHSYLDKEELHFEISIHST